MKSKSLRTFFFMVLALMLLICVNGRSPALAEDFPSKPISIIVAWAPGSGTDIGARILASIAPRYFDVPVNVHNITGGGGTIGTRHVAKAIPDGHTLLFGWGGGEHTTAPYLRKVPFDTLKDFVPIILVTHMPPVIVAKKEAPFNSIEELIKVAKGNPPGKLKYGASGTGTGTDLVPVVLGIKAGVKFTSVPFTGSGPTVSAVVGGHVDFGSVPIGAAASLVEAGDLKALAISSAERFPSAKEIPTFRELGYDITLDSLKGLAAPAGTPKDRIAILHDKFKKCLDDKQMKKLMSSMMLDIMYEGPDQYRATVERLIKDYGEILKKIGLVKSEG
jgi:tripartite-type tricarboxylate transporter receptor subunit TctC